MPDCQNNKETLFDLQRTSSSPISRLHPELLWTIFAINTDYAPSVEALLDATTQHLKTARHTSQVSQAWREIFIGSSSLWGRLIDLDLLDQQSDEWRDEVIHRASAAPLWIKGIIKVEQHGKLGTASMKWLFSKLLNDDTRWRTVQRVLIRVDNALDANDQQWQFLLSPAPELESFQIYSYEDTRHLRPAPADLFSGQAPLLCRFDAIDLTFPSETRWLTNLQHICLPHWSTLREVLAMLRHAPFLKSITMYPFSRVDGTTEIYQQHRHVHLPRLAKLTLYEDVDTVFTFLRYVTPSPQCSFFVRAEGYSKFSEATDIPETIRASFSSRLQIYLNAHTPTSISLASSDTQFHFRSSSSHSDSAFSLEIIDWRPTLDLRALLVNAVASLYSSPLCSSSITELNLLAPYPYLDQSTFTPLILALSSIKDIQTTESTLRLLSKLQQINYDSGHVSLFFPALQILRISSLDSIYLADGEEKLPCAVIPFLTERKASGAAISLLDFTGCRRTSLRDMESLEIVSGLKVMWKRGEEMMEYICGGGRSDKLDFRNHM